MPSGTIFEKFITIPAEVLDKFKWTRYTLKHEYLCAGQKCRNVMGIRAERMTRMATIEIKMLGGFEIRVNGKPVLAQLAQSRQGNGAGVVSRFAARGARLPQGTDRYPVGRGTVHQPGHGPARHLASLPPYDRRGGSG